jgi:hypothetical protein
VQKKKAKKKPHPKKKEKKRKGKKKKERRKKEKRNISCIFEFACTYQSVLELFLVLSCGIVCV